MLEDFDMVNQFENIQEPFDDCKEIIDVFRE